jgi:hypothetical protein
MPAPGLETFHSIVPFRETAACQADSRGSRFKRQRVLV